MNGITRHRLYLYYLYKFIFKLKSLNKYKRQEDPIELQFNNLQNYIIWVGATKDNSSLKHMIYKSINDPKTRPMN